MWATIIDESAPHGRMLDEDDTEALYDLVQIFLGEKNIEGAAAFVINDKVRVTIAA